jgi:hypothetical protein
MANGRKPEISDSLSSPHNWWRNSMRVCSPPKNEQESRRAKLVELSSLAPEEFARRFVTNAQVETEIVRLFAARSAKSHRIYVGANYVGKTARHAESPPIQSKLGVHLTPQDLRTRGPHPIKPKRSQSDT